MNPGIAATVLGGVDTHLESHVAAAVDANGGVLGVEGTGSYGAGLARHLAGKGIDVVEVDRPNRQARHRAGKTDAVDAIAAARAALTGTASGFRSRGPGPSKRSG